MDRPKQKIVVEVDADMVVREGVLVVRGFREDGRAFWHSFTVEETPTWTMSDLCRRAHLRFEELLRARG